MTPVAAEDLIAALRQKGLRVTRPRRAVCEALVSSRGEHLTAADIHARAAASVDAAVDQSTVYRTLDTLEEAGLLTHTHLGHGALVYHLAAEEPHVHLVCNRCGRAIGVPESDLAGFFDELTRLTGFAADPIHVAIAGICGECRASTAG